MLTDVVNLTDTCRYLSTHLIWPCKQKLVRQRHPVPRIFSNKLYPENLFKLRYLEGREHKDRDESITIENGYVKLKQVIRWVSRFWYKLRTSGWNLFCDTIWPWWISLLLSWPWLCRVLLILHSCNFGTIYERRIASPTFGFGLTHGDHDN